MDKSVHSQYSNLLMIKTAWKLIKPYRAAFWFATIFKIISNVGILILPWILAKIVTFISNPANWSDHRFIINQVIFLTVATLISFALRYWANFLFYPIAEKVGVDSMNEAFKHLLLLDASWHEGESSGKNLQKVNLGQSSLNQLLRFYLPAKTARR